MVERMPAMMRMILSLVMRSLAIRPKTTRVGLTKKSNRVVPSTIPNHTPTRRSTLSTNSHAFSLVAWRVVGHVVDWLEPVVPLEAGKVPPVVLPLSWFVHDSTRCFAGFKC